MSSPGVGGVDSVEGVSRGCRLTPVSTVSTVSRECRECVESVEPGLKDFEDDPDGYAYGTSTYHFNRYIAGLVKEIDQSFSWFPYTGFSRINREMREQLHSWLQQQKKDKEDHHAYKRGTSLACKRGDDLYV